MPKLSIITINYNNLEGLKKTLNSVFEQNYQDFEYILIDGGSTDGSRELIEQNADKFIYWVSEQDKGIYNAMNKGINVAKGDYCLFLNSGDWLFDPSTLKNVKANLSKKADILIGSTIEVDVNGKFVYERKNTEFTLYTLSYTSFPHQASFFSRPLLKELNGYDENFKVISDWLFYFRSIIEKNANICSIDIKVAYFEQGGLSSSFDIENEKLEAIKKYHPFFLKEYPTYKRYHNLILSRAVKFYQKIRIYIPTF